MDLKEEVSHYLLCHCNITTLQPCIKARSTVDCHQLGDSQNIRTGS